MTASLGHVGLTVSELERSVRFYVEVAGMHEQLKQMTTAHNEFYATRIALYEALVVLHYTHPHAASRIAAAVL